MSLEKLRETLEKELPPVFCRKVAEEKTGGMVTKIRLRDVDHLGLGPKGRCRIGRRKVGYQREEFIDWFMDRMKSLDAEV